MTTPTDDLIAKLEVSEAANKAKTETILEQQARIESLSAEVERVAKERDGATATLNKYMAARPKDAQEASASEARVRALEEALRAQSAIIQNAQEVMASYLPPDGIPQEEAVGKVLFILDGPDQRVAKALTDAALGASNG